VGQTSVCGGLQPAFRKYFNPVAGGLKSAAG